MYYKLYGSVAGWKELDRSNEEVDIVDTMGYYISNNGEINYLVIQCLDNQDIVRKTVKTRQDYVDYFNEVKGEIKRLTKKK